MIVLKLQVLQIATENTVLCWLAEQSGMTPSTTQLHGSWIQQKGQIERGGVCRGVT